MLIHYTGYIGEFEIIDDHRSGKIVIQLNGRLNKTGVISPRFNVQVTQIESWVNLLLPARGFGIIILVCQLRLRLLRMLTGYRQPRLAFWTTKKHVEKMSEESCSDMCTRFPKIYREN
jgi:hypothetical protein